MICVLIWVVFSLAVAILFCLVGERLAVVRTMAGTWYHYNSLPAYISTVAVFMGFLNIRLKENTFSAAIRYVAPSTFGVYLIHAHANMSPYIWERLDLPRFVSSPLFPLIQLAAVFGVFTVCTAVDIIRRLSIGRVERSDMVFSFSDSIKRMVSLFMERIRE